MQPLVFIPTITTGSDDSLLAEVGLNDLARDGGADWLPVTDASLWDAVEGDKPREESRIGMRASWSTGDPETDVPRTSVLPAEYAWYPSPPAGPDGGMLSLEDEQEPAFPKGAYWLGLPRDEELWPGPAELKRAKVVDGEPLELNDGRKWIVPAARSCTGVIGPDLDSGVCSMDVDPRLAGFYERAFLHFSTLAEREDELGSMRRCYFGIKLTQADMQILHQANQVNLWKLQEAGMLNNVGVLFEDAVAQAIDALTINYRLTPFLIRMLRLLTKDLVTQVCLWAIEAPWILEDVKKNELEADISLLAGSGT